MANTHSATFVRASSQQLTSVHSTNFSSASYTVEAWIKRASTGTTQIIMAKDSGGAAGWAFFITTGNVLQLLHQSIGAVSGLTAITNTSTWYHVAATYNGTTARIYIDGTEDNNGALSAFSASSNVQRIGANNDGNYFDGKIDEIRYWNVVRTQTEINNNKSVQIDSATNLIGSWHVDNALTDSSGNGHTLTNVNSVTFTTDVPFSGAVAGSDPMFMGAAF